MQKYFDSFIQMITLRGLTDHTVKSYSTYIRTYLDYLDTILHKLPEAVSWQELRDYLIYIQKARSLSDRTMNACIAQLRFFSLSMFFISLGILIRFQVVALILIYLLFLLKLKLQPSFQL